MTTTFPFAFAKNRFLEHGPVVVPAFGDRSLSAQLRQTADGTLSPEGTIFHMACSLEGGGEFDAFFVARDARERDVGKKGDALLRDDRGRRFIIVLGFLTSGSDGIRDVSEPNLQLLERSIRIPMRGFWESREWNRQRAFFVNGLELPLHDNDGPLLKTVEFALRHEYAGFDEKPQPVVVPEEKRERKIGLALLLVGGSIAALSFALPTNFRAAAIAIGSAFIACAMIPIFRR